MNRRWRNFFRLVALLCMLVLVTGCADSGTFVLQKPTPLLTKTEIVSSTEPAVAAILPVLPTFVSQNPTPHTSAQLQFVWQVGGGLNVAARSVRYIAVAMQGAIYSSDTETGSIQKLDKTGRVLWQIENALNQNKLKQDVPTVSAVVPLLRLPGPIAVDSAGRLYVLEESGDHHQIVVFDGNGQNSDSWQVEYTTPAYIAIDRQNTVYIADSEQIQRFDSSGNRLSVWANPNVGSQDKAGLLGGAAVDVHGWLYLAYTFPGHIQTFDPTGHVSESWPLLAGSDGHTPNADSLALDAQSNVYVFDSNNQLQIFNRHGHALAQWAYADDRQFNNPTGVAVDGNGIVFVADGIDRIQAFTNDGQKVADLGDDGRASGHFAGPGAVAVTTQGNVYVTDTGNARIQKFDNDGRFVTLWGNSGRGAGQFGVPGSIGVDSKGFVYVADPDNYRIQKFDGFGHFIRQWGSAGHGYGQFGRIGALTIDEHDNIYVADPDNYRIQKFGPGGQFLLSWGSLGTGNGQFALFGYGTGSPMTVISDKHGTLFVPDAYGGNHVQTFDEGGHFLANLEFASTSESLTIDTHNNMYVPLYRLCACIEKYDAAGHLLARWENPGTAQEQFGEVAALTVDNADALYVVDTTNNRVEKFRQPG